MTDTQEYKRVCDRIALIIGDRLMSATDPMETFTLGSIMGLLDQVGHGCLIGNDLLDAAKSWMEQ
jgi:hypothetical protein